MPREFVGVSKHRTRSPSLSSSYDFSSRPTPSPHPVKPLELSVGSIFASPVTSWLTQKVEYGECASNYRYAHEAKSGCRRSQSP